MSISVQCESCKHYILPGRCAAFDRIPDVITRGRFDHREPYPDAENPEDRGIRWEQGPFFKEVMDIIDGG